MIAVRVAQVHGRPLAIGAVALDDPALERHALIPERPNELVQIRAADREADVVEPAARLVPGGRQEVDQVLAEPELAERDLLVHPAAGAAEDVLVASWWRSGPTGSSRASGCAGRRSLGSRREMIGDGMELLAAVLWGATTVVINAAAILLVAAGIYVVNQTGGPARA